MNSNFSLSRSALVVLAGLALPALPALAAPVPAPATGDLYLAFRAGGGEGGTSSYIVKLGTDTTFRNAAAGSSFTVSGLGNISVDLAAVYGENWNTRSDLFWGIFGVRPSVNSIIYASRERVPVGTDSTAWNNIDQLSRNSTASQITSVLENIGGYKGREATENSTVATFQPNTADASSYAKQVATAGTTDFGSLSEWTSIEGDFGGGTSGTALDLFRLAGSGVTRVGKFTISSAGVVQFTAPSATVPDVDTDGDGFLDSAEVIAGTSPTNAADFFRVSSVSILPSGSAVTFNAIPARSYKIYYSQDLAAGSWVLIDTVSGPASPSAYQYVDTDAVRKARPKGFYKVIVSQ